MAFGSIFQVPTGWTVTLEQNHCIDPSEPKSISFDKTEISIGRSPECDVVLAVPSVAKHHARVFVRDGECWIEDAGSSLGTFIDQKKLVKGEPRQLQPTESFTIFPYRITATASRIWKSEDKASVSAARLENIYWSAFRKSQSPQALLSSIEAHPIGERAYLEADREFLEGLLIRSLGPIANGPTALSAADSGVVEYLLISFLQSVNQSLSFPIRVSPSVVCGEPSVPPRTPGVAVWLSVKLAGLVGSVRLFLPYRFLQALRDVAPPLTKRDLPDGIAWRCPISYASLDLTSEEMARLEPGDILLIQPSPEVQLPGSGDNGWSATEALGMNGKWSFTIDNYWERSPAMSMDVAGNESTPDLSKLPLRLHVVLGEREFTLAELQTLAPGAIVELDKEKTEPVSLAVNGKILGSGELVEIDGRLGVKVLNWSEGSPRSDSA